MDVLDYLQKAHVVSEDLYAMMHKQDHPHYGATLRAAKGCAAFLGGLQDALPAIADWVATYEANRARLWMISVLKKGHELLWNYERTWSSVDRIPKPNTALQVAWAPVETALATVTEAANVDIALGSALQTFYVAACKTPSHPIVQGVKSHEGPCCGGLICFECDGEEWDWHTACFKDAKAALVRNIFWNTDLQNDFLTEVEAQNAWDRVAVPADWCIPALSTYPYSANDDGAFPVCRTPFQYSQALAERVSSRWSVWNIAKYAKTPMGHRAIYEGLRRILRDAPLHLAGDLAICDTVRDMF